MGAWRSVIISHFDSPWVHSACGRQRLIHNHLICFCVGMGKSADTLPISSQSHSDITISLACQCNMPKLYLGQWHMGVNARFIFIFATPIPLHVCTFHTLSSLPPPLTLMGSLPLNQWYVSFQIPPLCWRTNNSDLEFDTEDSWILRKSQGFRKVSGDSQALEVGSISSARHLRCASEAKR